MSQSLTTDKRVNKPTGGGAAAWGGITGTLSSQTDLQSALDGKASTSHTHTVSQITDLTASATELNYTDGVTSAIQTQLDGKAATSHTHTASNITDFNTAVDARITGKQDTLVSGTNIKTVNGSSLLGSGNLAVNAAGLPVYNQSVAQQGAGFATDTYLTGSSISIPSGALKIGSRYHLIFDVSKTAAGTATPIITIRFGTNGTTADTARLTFTFLAQTAAADIGTFEVWVTFRTVGSGTSAVMQGTAQVRHRLQITGLQNLVSTTLQVTSGGFDSTVANSIIGASVNAGASAAWTVQLVQAELLNIN